MASVLLRLRFIEFPFPSYIQDSGYLLPQMWLELGVREFCFER